MHFEKLSVHELFDKNVKIWRYMDFTKFVHLLTEKSLYFSRVDKFGDPFEGSITRKDFEEREVYNHPINIETLQKRNKNMLRFTAANCWHMNENESAAMWQLYTTGNEGIAIQTTIQSLMKSFNHPDDQISIAPIQYIDYEKFQEVYDSISLIRPFLFKRKSFTHEQELRAIIVRLPIEKNNKGGNEVNFESPQDTINGGVIVPVKLEQLIQEIFVSPTSDPWFKDLVKSMVNVFKLDRSIIKSSLSYDSPLY